MSREIKSLKLYPFSPSEDTAIYQQDYCIHKNVCQIPSYILTNPDIDFNIMKQAIRIEFERNDCLRIGCVKTKNAETGKKGWHQYFRPEVNDIDIPFMDFTGQTEEDMLAWIKADAALPVKITKEEVVRFKLFRAPDGRAGIYMIISHVVADMVGAFITYKDIFEVYKALKNDTPMPKPLYSYEEGLKKELDKLHNEKLYAKNDSFYKNLFESEQPSFFAGVDRMRQLNKARQKKKKPDLRYINIFDPLHDKAEVIMKHISGEDIIRYNDFCNENHITLQDLIYMGCRTYLSAVNERTDDVYWHGILHRRSTLAQKYQGGCYMHAFPFRSIIKEDQTFLDALIGVDNMIMDLYRHSDHPTKRIFDICDANEKRPLGCNTASGLFSVLAPGVITPPEGFSWEVHGVNPGRFAMITYLTCIPSFVDDGLDAYFVYKTHLYTDEEAEALLDKTIEVIEKGIADPDITIGRLLDELQGR